MPIIDKENWEKCVEVNDDPYSKCCVDVAREVMNILDKGEPIIDVHKVIGDAEKNIGNDETKSLTGFMAGMVAGMIKSFHSRGEEFNDKWNEAYGCSKEKAKGGTVNPAIINIG